MIRPDCRKIIRTALVSLGMGVVGLTTLISFRNSKASHRSVSSHPSPIQESEEALWQSLKWNTYTIELKPIKVKTAYQSLPNRIEEKIILENPEAIQKAAESVFVFELNTHGLTFKDVGGGVWYFYDQNGEAIFRIPKSYAVDDKGNFTNDVSTEVSEQENSSTTKTTVRLSIDDESWLISPLRALPITTKLVLEVVPEKR